MAQKPEKQVVEPGSPHRAVGYLRVSTDAQELGPEAQRAAIARWVEARGGEVVAWYSDLGVSGDTPPDERPGLVSAVAALRGYRAGLLVAAARDRLAREPRLAGVVELLVEKEGARVVTLDDVAPDDPTGLASRMTRAIKDVLAAEELARIRTRTKAALDVKKARGERVGSVPLGFYADEEGRLHPNPDERELAQRAAFFAAQGLGLRETARRLAQEGFNLRGSPSGVTLHPQTVKRLIAAREGWAD